MNLGNSKLSTMDAMRCSRSFNYETPLLHMRNTPPTGGQESFIFVSPGEQKRQGLSTITEREFQEVAEEIKYIGIYNRNNI
ncbi:hypothetical protein ACN38_g7464 [Penicillium nordicum]|uniref:Uncharacterized protein n=1 Tax=Penicillium nordicum TaxID=229535 RepID=A0A0M8NY49_9EURO|nr:hypothetical protein ACN38_g7464 [Penicillium nordicum]